MEIFDKTSGVRINHKKNICQREGEPVIFPLEPYSKKKKATKASVTVLENKLKTQIEKLNSQNQIASVVYIIMIVSMLCGFLITMLCIVLFSSRFEMYPLSIFSLFCLLGSILCTILLKKQKKTSQQSTQNYLEAMELLSVDPPEIYEYRIIEKQWYEAVEETSCYYFKFDHFSLCVDLAKYNATNAGDYVSLAILKTKNSNLLFIL